MAQIRFVDVTKRFGDVAAVKAYNATVKHGEFMSILGPSGCGKTTLLRMLAGFERPTGGDIFIGETQVAGAGVYVPPEKRNIGMVFQSYAVWPHMNVFDNIAYPLKIRGMSKNEIKPKVEQTLELVHMPGLGGRLPSQLSGGQQQRVALARALVAEPDLLLLDESLSNLDAKLREVMRFELKELQARLNITVVYVTHDQAEAMAMSDRICVMRAGAIEQIGTPREIYQQPASQFVADFVGSINFLPGLVTGEGVKVAASGGRLIRCKLPAGAAGDVVVAFRPEHVRVVRPGDSTDGLVGQVSGVVRQTFYLGKDVEVRISVDDHELRMTADAGIAPATGDTVTLGITQAYAFAK